MSNIITSTRINNMQQIISTRKTYSAWDRGVTAYALDLLDNLHDNTGDSVDTCTDIDTLSLAGAEDWQQYSYGGCSLTYDGDIAHRLCTPSELRKTRGGVLPPNSRECWLDVQARALHQAAVVVRAAWMTSGIWYAVLFDGSDTDHGVGAWDLCEAAAMACKARKDGNPDAYVAAIDPDDDYCIAIYSDPADLDICKEA